MDGPQILIPYDPTEALTIAEAAKVAGRSDDTVRRWAQLHDLGDEEWEAKYGQPDPWREH